MRSSIILGALALASSVFAAPAQKQDVSDILDRVDKTLEVVNDNLGKRNPQVDLDGIVDTVTDTVNGLVRKLDDLLNTINDLDAAIGDQFKDIEGDDNGVLSTIAAEVPVAIDLVNSIVEDVDTEGALTGIADEVTSVISEVQTLLADVEAVASVVNGPDTIATAESRLQELLSTLTNLLNQISLKQ